MISTKRLLTILGIFSLFSIATTCARILYLRNMTYDFLIWNLFLAWIPFCTSLALLVMNKKRSSWLLQSIAFVTWFLFLPNTFYIITDFIHLKQIKIIMPFWFDAIMLFSYSWNGILLGSISLLMIHDMIEEKYTSLTSWLFVSAVLIASSFGIYLGRFLRWNSWDVITNPVALLQDVIVRILYPTQHPRTVAFTILFSVFSFCAYLTIRFIITSLGVRFKLAKNK